MLASGPRWPMMRVPNNSRACTPPRARRCQPPPTTCPSGVHVHHAGHLRHPPTRLIHRCRSKPSPFLPLCAPHRSLYSVSLFLLTYRTTHSSTLPTMAVAATAATRASGAASIMHKRSPLRGAPPRATRVYPWLPRALVLLTTVRASSTTATSGPPPVKPPPP
jgi:hypothetical protein